MGEDTRGRRADRTPRQRLGAHARQPAILEAAMAEFAGAPYAEVKVADVAARASASSALVFRYYGTKATLYAAVVEGSAELLLERQQEADEALAPGVPARDRVRASLEVYLDHVASHPAAWANPLLGGEEPPEALQVRRQVRERYVELLRDVLATSTWPRHEYALHGYFGFVDQACLTWVGRGCPHDQRPGLVDAALGALEGALGDWGS